MVQLFHSATALDSLRNTDFDFPTAVGELIDNSLQANASRVDINVLTTSERIGDQSEVDKISKVIVSDNGDGMPIDVLHRCLQFGFSTRYNDRNGIGRFGVGATYAGISQSKKITIISRLQLKSIFMLHILTWY